MGRSVNTSQKQLCEGYTSLSYAQTDSLACQISIAAHESQVSILVSCDVCWWQSCCVVWSSTSCRTFAIIHDSLRAMFPHIHALRQRAQRLTVVSHFRSINNDRVNLSQSLSTRKVIEMTANSPFTLERLKRSLHENE